MVWIFVLVLVGVGAGVGVGACTGIKDFMDISAFLRILSAKPWDLRKSSGA